MDNNDRHAFAMFADSLETYRVVLYAYIMMNLERKLSSSCEVFRFDPSACYTALKNVSPVGWCLGSVRTG